MPPDEVLLRSQKNTFVNMIKDVGLEPSAFSWRRIQEPSSAPSEQIEHRASQYYFRIWHGIGAGFNVEYRPGMDEPVAFAHGLEWEGLATLAMTVWLVCLGHEIQAPDLWAEVAKEQGLGELAKPSGPDRPFTPEERVQIAAKLDELHRFLVTTQELKGEQERFVRTRLDYLKEASERQTRDAWVLMFMGVVLSIILAPIVPPDTVREFFRFIAVQFTGLGGLLPGK